MKTILCCAAALLASAITTNAADLPARPYVAPAAPMYNWTGFYLGVHGGYAWSDSVTAGITGFGTITGSSSDLNGGFGGGQIGYNWQIAPSWIFGIEADAAGANISWGIADAFGNSAGSKIQSLGSVTGRLGFTVNNALFYGKGGWGWADNKATLTEFGVGSLSDSQFHSGWTAGAGIEYGFAQNWSVKAEYQYYDLGNQTYFNVLELGTTLHTIKGGVNYRF